MEVSVINLLSGPGKVEDNAIAHFRFPTIPTVRFEWHPDKKRVYLIRVGRTPEVGEPIAYDVMDHGAAWNIVLVWSRGFRYAQEMHLTGDAAEENIIKRIKGAGEVP